MSAKAGMIEKTEYNNILLIIMIKNYNHPGEWQIIKKKYT